MKKLLFFITLLVFCQVATAAELMLQFQVTGIKGKALQNITDRLNTEQKALSTPLTYTKIQKLYNWAPLNIQKALEPYGYFHAAVKPTLTHKNQQYSLILKVTPGPVTHITESNITLEGPGKYDKSLLWLMYKTRKKLAVGRALNTDNYDRLKQKFFTFSENQGYLKGYFKTHIIRIDKDTNTATITLIFNTGPRYYFGQVYFSKNPMALSLLKRFVPFEAGQPFSSKKLLKLQTDLNSTVYFNRVTVSSHVKNARHYQIPIHVKLHPAKAQQYSFGLGYGTDTGARASVGWQWRRVTPTGHYLQTLLQVSQKRNDNFQARYIIPGKHPSTDHYALTAGVFTNEPGSGSDEYTTEQVGASYTKSYDWWLRTISLQFQHENFNFNNVNKTSNTLIPSVSWEKVKAYNRINTINGYRVYFQLDAGAVSKFDASFLQAEFKGKYIRSFDKQRNRLILTSELGMTYVKDFADMPLSQRYFAGGAQTLRGYDYQALGPGRYLVVGGIEWQHRLHGKFYGALFYNAGNAAQNLPLNLQQAVGVGVLYRSPIGPIEVTVAHPFNEPDKLNFHDYRVQFTMGPDL